MTEPQMRELDKKINAMTVEELRICLTEVVESRFEDDNFGSDFVFDTLTEWELLP